jgi:hypothetical protein
MNIHIRNCLICIVLFLTLPILARADGYSFIRKFTMDRLELEVQVTDEQISHWWVP